MSKCNGSYSVYRPFEPADAANTTRVTMQPGSIVTVEGITTFINCAVSNGNVTTPPINATVGTLTITSTPGSLYFSTEGHYAQVTTIGVDSLVHPDNNVGE